LGATTLSLQGKWTAAFVQRLRELGWVEGRTVAIEYRWAEGSSERAAESVAEFVRRKVDVIVASGGANVAAAAGVTSVIPIVFPAAGDPVGTGLVASLAHPGGNVTGLSLQQSDLGTKRLEVLRELIPALGRLAIMAHGDDNSAAESEMREVQEAARALGLDAAIVGIRSAKDILPAFDALMGRADAVYVCADPLLTTNRTRIAILAAGLHLPTMYHFREYVEAGGLMSYGPNFPDLFRRAADYVDKILRGAKPGDIPVEQPTKFDLVINLTTAKALGLTIPESFLLRADEVIE